jgi:ubiquinone/menaquinone biosynthesis C-methylase UbiE
MKDFDSLLTDEQERRNWQFPERILSDIGLKPGMTFMDVGCGQGFFTMPAARIVGETGKVCGIDISQTNIDKLKAKVVKAGLKNVLLKTGKAEELILCKACVDILFFGIVLHDFESPDKVLANARVMLKPNGKLIDLDWKKKAMEIGPPLPVRFSEAKARQLIVESGFKVESIQNNGTYHYIIAAVPDGAQKEAIK